MLQTVQTLRHWHCEQNAFALQSEQIPVLVIPNVLGEQPVQTGDAGAVTVVQLAHCDIFVHAPAGDVLTGQTAGGAVVGAAGGPLVPVTIAPLVPVTIGPLVPVTIGPLVPVTVGTVVADDGIHHVLEGEFAAGLLVKPGLQPPGSHSNAPFTRQVVQPAAQAPQDPPATGPFPGLH